jgi:RHS repeat-associated protein
MARFAVGLSLCLLVNSFAFAQTMAAPALGLALQSLQIVPSAVTGHTGDTIAVQVIGTYSDGSKRNLTGTATWTSANTAVATAVTAQPQVTVVSAGGQLSTTLSATVNTGSGNELTATLALTVLPGTNRLERSLAPTSYPLRGSSIGLVPFSTLSGGPIASLNVATDNILINIPVRAKSEQIPFSYSLVGNSSAEVPFGWSQWLVNTGIQGQIGGLLGANVSVSESGGHTCYGDTNDVWITNFAIVDASGATHPVSSATLDTGVPYNGGWVHCEGTTMSGGANDNSGISMTYTTSGSPTWTIYDVHGNSVYPASGTVKTLKEKNGNEMSSTTATNGISIVDSEGVTVLTTSLQGSCAGCVDTYSYTDDIGATQKFTVAYGTYTYSTKFGCQGTDGIIDVTGIANQYFLPKTITIPKMTGDSAAGTYTLGYESTSGGTSGRLASITYPTGGKTTYTYAGGAGGGGINCTDELTVPSLTVKTTDTTSGVTGQWVYTNTAGIVSAKETVSVQDAMGNTETYTFNNGYLTELNQAGIIDNYVCYNGASGKSNCITPSTELPTTITESDVYSSMANGAANTYNRTETAFQGQFVTSVTKWDLPGTGTAKTETEITPITVNRALLPSVVEVIDPTQSNKKMALTNFYYDPKGNLTKRQNWVSGTSYLTSTYSPNTNGTPGTMTDPNGTVTTFNYTSGVCNELVPTRITNNYNSLTSSVGMDSGCNQGLAINQTPVSGYISSQTFNDPFFRKDSHTDEDGILVKKNYRLNRVTTSEAFNGGTLEHISTLDSLGRVVNEQTQNGSSYDTVQTSYDAMGRISFVSAPFSCGTAGGCSSTIGTTTTYDAAGRIHTVTDANGGIITHSYSVQANVGNVDLSVLTPTPSGDQTVTGKTRALQTNGLGELIAVCEVNTYGDAAACGLGLSNFGYVTNYFYDALGNLTTVNQGSSQSRSFSYDGLGRMTAETNPENGTTRYHFDSSSMCGLTSAGDLNDIDPNNGYFTCFSYDPLHRIIARTHLTDPTTDNAQFIWDSSTIENGTINVGQPGRLAQAWTCAPTTVNCLSNFKTVEGFTYEPRGDINWFYQSSPHSGGFYSVGETRDAIGNMNFLGGIPAVPSLTIGAYDYEGRPTQINANAGTSPVAESITYGYFGALSVTYGSGDYDTFTYDSLGHMTSYLYNIGASSYYKGSLSWNSNGTLGSLYTVDKLPGNGGGDGINTTYNYDDLGRLWHAVGGNLSQTYNLDRYGNLGIYGPPTSWTPSYTSQNQYVIGGACNGSGICYDGNGNLTSDTFHSYTWDVENKLLSVDGGTSNVYDAFGKAVEKAGYEYLQVPNLPAGSEVQMLGPNLRGAILPLPGGGAVIYQQGGIEGYQHIDWNGNSRVVSTWGRTLSSQTEYSPFGTAFDKSSSVAWTMFDGAFSSTMSGGYDTPNRNLFVTQGRWIQPDPAGLAAVDSSNPQTWNRYAYVLNNPLSNVDPDGLDCVYLNDAGNGVESIDHNSNAGECTGINGSNGGYWVPGTVANSSWVTSIDQNNSAIGAFSVVDPQNAPGVLGFTASTNNAYGIDYTTVGVDVPNTNVVGNVYTSADDLSPSGQAAALALHDAFAKFPNVCSIGINLSVGAGGKVNARVDANTQKGVNLNGQISTPLAPFVSARYLIGTNGEVPNVAGVSLRAGGPTGVTMGITPSGNITSVGVNQKFGIGSAGAYLGVGVFYQCP